MSEAFEFPPWKDLVRRAEAEVARVVGRLPAALRDHAQRVPVAYLPEPTEELVADGLDRDVLGLFVGEALAERGQSLAPLPAQILLFLDNLWDYADGDEAVFAEEVRTTYVHELGHFLGLDEGQLGERGLE